jgi:hypothetical protein
MEPMRTQSAVTHPSSLDSHRQPVSAPHLGWQAVRQVHELLMVDEDFTLWHEGGFTWWPHRLAQRFRCEGPVEVDGVPTWWIGFETD